MSSAAVVPRHAVPLARVSDATQRAASTARGVRHPVMSRTTSPSGYRRHAHPRVRSRTHHVPRAVGDARGDGREAKPAVAVVKTSACPHCRRAEAALREAGIAFVEIDASDADGVVRDAASAVSGMRTVPQVFVGGACVGGADDTIAAIESGEMNDKVARALADALDATPPSLAAAAAAAATNERATQALSLSSAASSSGFFPPEDASVFAVLDDAVKRMSRDLTPRDLWTFGGWRRPLNLERRVVFGKDVAAWIKSDEKTTRAFTFPGDAETSDAKISLIALKMHELGLIVSADGSRVLDERVVRDEDGAGSIPFRLADHAAAPSSFPDTKPLAALNARRRFRGPARDAREVAADLRSRILELHDKFLSQDGSFVDYEKMRSSDAFEEYLRAAEALQTVSLCSLTNAEKTAFFVNLYNALVVHVTVVAGPPKTGIAGFFDRLSYFDRHAYEIEGVTYTCDDIEHGCLRGNKPGAASLGAILGVPRLSRGPFSTHKNDPRRRNAIVPPDPRVHFALNCGAKSCPPIRLYDGDKLESQLAAAAAAFAESETSVLFGETGAVVQTSKIVGDWYKWDFGTDDKERVAALSEYAGEETPLGRELKRAAQTPGVVIATREYDWDLNGKA